MRLRGFRGPMACPGQPSRGAVRSRRQADAAEGAERTTLFTVLFDRIEVQAVQGVGVKVVAVPKGRLASPLRITANGAGDASPALVPRIRRWRSGTPARYGACEVKPSALFPELVIESQYLIQFKWRLVDS